MPNHYDKKVKKKGGKSNAQKRCEGYMRKVKGTKTKKNK
jgi:hypothetical protein